MPELKDRYLATHQRTICHNCGFWVLWYQDPKGKPVHGCRLGLIPYRDKCDGLKSKSGQTTKRRTAPLAL